MASGAETLSVTFDSSTGQQWARVWCYGDGVTTGTAFYNHEEEEMLTDPDTLPGISTTADNDLVIIVCSESDNLITAATVTATNPAAFTLNGAFTPSSLGNDLVMFGYSATRTTAGATGTITIDPSGGLFNGMHCLAVALTTDTTPPSTSKGIKAFTRAQQTRRNQ